MKIELEIPNNTLIMSRSDLKNLLRELINEIEVEEKGKDILTIAEAANYMGLSIPSVRKLIDSNKMPHYRIDSIVRLSRRKILEIVGGETYDINKN
jgi:excisionase family DNA binding protein